MPATIRPETEPEPESSRASGVQRLCCAILIDAIRRLGDAPMRDWTGGGWVDGEPARTATMWFTNPADGGIPLGVVCEALGLDCGGIVARAGDLIARRRRILERLNAGRLTPGAACQWLAEPVRETRATDRR